MPLPIEIAPMQPIPVHPPVIITTVVTRHAIATEAIRSIHIKHIHEPKIACSAFEDSIITIDRSTISLTHTEVAKLFSALPKLEQVSALNGVWRRI